MTAHPRLFIAIAASLWLAEQTRYVFDGFIVTRDGLYTGLGTGLDLIRALTERRHAELQQMA